MSSKIETNIYYILVISIHSLYSDVYSNSLPNDSIDEIIIRMNEWKPKSYWYLLNDCDNEQTYELLAVITVNGISMLTCR